MLTDRFLAAYARTRLRQAMRFDQTGAPPIDNRDPPQAPGGATPLLLYMHVPFCEGLCPYCSFHRVPFQPALAREYFHALRRELRMYHDRGYRFDAAYVGGGTPTLLPEELAATVETARGLWPGIRRLSVETNPNHLTAGHLAHLRAMGVDRLSVGVQSFQDEILKRIGRYERYGAGAAVADRLRQVRGNFPTLNVDMIFNFPGQTEEMLRRDLDTLLELKLDQVTWYPLMPGRSVADRLAAQRGGRRSGERRLYARIREALEADYEPASAWCFSRRAGSGGRRDPQAPLLDEYIVDHDEYAGLGSGAFGYVDGSLYANTFEIPRYIRLVNRGRPPLAASRRFSPQDRLLYDFLMKLFGGRLDTVALRRRHGPAALRRLAVPITVFRAIGALAPAGRHLALTARGRYIWVILMREFFTAVNDLREHCRTRLRDEKEAP